MAINKTVNKSTSSQGAMRNCIEYVLKYAKILSEEAFDFGREFVEKWFPNHQTLICIHQDRDHVHIHFVTITLSFIDGTYRDLGDISRHKEIGCITANAVYKFY